MIFAEKTLEMRGIRRSEIVDYFKSINGEEVSDGKFIVRESKVEVSEESFAQLGSFKLPATKVKFRGKKEFIEPLISAFSLKFLRAGG
jgi:hypothetical protein